MPGSATYVTGSSSHKSKPSGDYAPGLAIPRALKDVGLALAEAETVGAPMPSVSLVRDRMITVIARGHAALERTALGLVALEEAGLRCDLR